jgi:hypothetical protein
VRISGTACAWSQSLVKARWIPRPRDYCSSFASTLFDCASPSGPRVWESPGRGGDGGRSPFRIRLQAVVTSCFHDRSSYRGLSPHLQRAPRYRADGIFDMPVTDPVHGGAYKTLHWMAIPLRSIATSEPGRRRAPIKWIDSIIKPAF